jgi:hypothetical protein
MKKILLATITLSILLFFSFVFLNNLVATEMIVSEQNQRIIKNNISSDQIVSLEQIAVLAEEMSFQPTSNVVYIQLTGDQVAWR